MYIVWYLYADIDIIIYVYKYNIAVSLLWVFAGNNGKRRASAEYGSVDKYDPFNPSSCMKLVWSIDAIAILAERCYALDQSNRIDSII